MALGKLDSYMQKSETGPPTYTIYKNELKMNYLNIRPETIKVLIENIGRISFDIILSNFFFFAYIS